MCLYESIGKVGIGNPNGIQINANMCDSYTTHHTTTYSPPRLQLCKVINIAPCTQAISSLVVLNYSGVSLMTDMGNMSTTGDTDLIEP